MKTEEQVLLKYMYEKGYTDEDMFDEKTMNKVRQSIEFRIYRIKLGFPKLLETWKAIAERLKLAWTIVAEKVREVWPIIKATQMKEPELPSYKTFAPIDFSKRPLIKDQVIDRKPKRLIKKIIH